MTRGLVATVVLASGLLWSLTLARVQIIIESSRRRRSLDAFMSRREEPEEGRGPSELWPWIGRRLLLPGEMTWLLKKLGSIGSPGASRVTELLTKKGKYFPVAAVLTFLLGATSTLSWLLCIAIAVVVLLYPDLELYNEEHYRNLEMSRRLPSSVDLLVLGVESGMSFLGALELIAEKEKGPVADELSRVLREIDIGKSRVEALTSLKERATEKSLRNFANALIQAETLGVGLGPVLREQSELLRKIRKEQAREQAQKIPVKILFPIMVCFVPCIFLIVLGPVGLSFMN